MAERAIYVITGSRDWRGDPQIIRASLVSFWARHEGVPCCVYHGACPHGASGRSVDMLADEFARELGWEVRAFPADWHRGGRRQHPDPAAGPERNSVMICAAAFEKARGLEVEAHGWPGPKSRGTYDCLRKAKQAGIHGVRHAVAKGGSGG